MNGNARGGAVRGLRVIAGTTAFVLALVGVASAIENPIVVAFKPTVPSGAHGRISFFQLGKDMVINVTLARDRPGTQSIGIFRGTCARHSARPDWVVVGVSGTNQATRVANLELRQLLGHVVIIHKTQNRNSTAIGCAKIVG